MRVRNNTQLNHGGAAQSKGEKRIVTGRAQTDYLKT